MCGSIVVAKLPTEKERSMSRIQRRLPEDDKVQQFESYDRNGVRERRVEAVELDQGNSGDACTCAKCTSQDR